jgi:hypothetical protein
LLQGSTPDGVLEMLGRPEKRDGTRSWLYDLGTDPATLLDDALLVVEFKGRRVNRTSLARS